MDSNPTLFSTQQTDGSLIIQDGIDSLWHLSGHFFLGQWGQGTLTIRNGGKVLVHGDALIDGWEESEGTLAFGIGTDGPGFLDIHDDLKIGETSTLMVLVELITRS